MFQNQQNIPQDSTAKQNVQKDLAADSLKKLSAGKTDSVKPKPKAVKAVPPPEPVATAQIDTLPKKDSLIAEIPVVSLFAGHELKPSNSGPVAKPDYYSDWVTVFLLGSVVLITYLRVAYSKRFFEFFRALLDVRFASQLVREERVLSQRVSVFLMVIFFFSASAFLYYLSVFFNVRVFSGEGFPVFVKTGFSVFVLFIFRVLIIELSGFIFNAQAEFSFYNFHIFLFNKALGLGLIPVLAGLVYADAFPQAVFIYAGIILFFISYLARLIRGLNIGLGKQGFNKFYLFFYFCTLEILPAVILAKIILNHTA